jgi:hypothetical protein
VKDAAWLRHPLLEGFAHGFGTRAAEVPLEIVRPRQVHGCVVLRAAPADAGLLDDGDAIVSTLPGVSIGVVTADCLPILIATPSGPVAAVHAGWRGLAAGVIAAAVETLASLARDVDRAAAVIGPHVGARCYEVDAPVVEALEARFGDALGGALRATRPGHFEIALATLAAFELSRSGLATERIATLDDACTACDAERFYSYRRDGPGGGRLFHFIAAR